MKRTALVFGLLVVPACDREQEAAAGEKVLAPLPPLELHARIPAYQEIASHAQDGQPDEGRMAELADLLDLAYTGQGRTAGMAKGSLMEAEDRKWAFEAGLAHDSVVVRMNCYWELGNLAQQDAIPPLLYRLKYELDPTARVWVCDALARLGNGAGLQELSDTVRTLHNTSGSSIVDNTAGQRAVEILKLAGVEVTPGTTFKVLAEQLDRLAETWRLEGVLALPDVELTPAVERRRARLAVHVLDLEGFQLRPVDDCRFIFSRTGAAELDLLRRALQAEEQYLRQHSLEIVRDLGPTAASLADEVLPLLNDPLSATLAVQTLGAIGATQHGGHAFARLDAPDLEMRVAAAGVMGELGVDAARPRLEALRADAERPMELRVAAAYSLAVFEMRDRPAYGFLKELKASGDFHEPTLDELLDKIDRLR